MAVKFGVAVAGNVGWCSIPAGPTRGTVLLVVEGFPVPVGVRWDCGV